MATRADRLVELNADLVKVKAALDKARAAVAVRTGDITIQRGYETLLKERRDLERRIAALDGTRAQVASIDMSGAF